MIVSGGAPQAKNTGVAALTKAGWSWAASQRLIAKGEQSGLQTRIVATESGSSVRADETALGAKASGNAGEGDRESQASQSESGTTQETLIASSISVVGSDYCHARTRARQRAVTTYFDSP
jgi:hypothetical protein